MILLGLGVAIFVGNENQGQEPQKELPIAVPDIQEQTEKGEDASNVLNDTKSETTVEDREDYKEEKQNQEKEPEENAEIQEKEKGKVIDLPLVPIERLR